jgi:hypothetical protein
MRPGNLRLCRRLTGDGKIRDLIVGQPEVDDCLGSGFGNLLGLDGAPCLRLGHAQFPRSRADSNFWSAPFGFSANLAGNLLVTQFHISGELPVTLKSRQLGTVQVFGQLRLFEVGLRPLQDLGVDFRPALELDGGEACRPMDQDPDRPGCLIFHTLLVAASHPNWHYEPISRSDFRMVSICAAVGFRQRLPTTMSSTCTLSILPRRITQSPYSASARQLGCGAEDIARSRP